MVTLVVVVHKGLDLALKLHAVATGIQIHPLPFDRAPKPLDPGVVRGSAFAVHGDSDLQVLLNVLRPKLTGVLAVLIAVDDLRGAVTLNSLLEHTQAPRRIHRVGDAMGQDPSAVHVHHGRQVHGSLGHRHVRDVSAPDLIGAGDGMRWSGKTGRV